MRSDLIARSDEREAGEPGEDEFIRNLQKNLDDLKKSGYSADQALLDLINKEVAAGTSDIPEIDRPAIDWWPLARKLWKYGGVIKRHLEWVYWLCSYRYKITGQLMKAYGQDNGCIDLFTPALIDYDRWVVDGPETNLQFQILLMEKNIRLYGGHVHPFFPFDPWKESLSPESPDGSLYWVKKAIMEHGFIGVKMYPPMGFSAIGNSDHKFYGMTKKQSAKFGQSLDKALWSLYDWCQEHDVPIMVHCNNSQETKEGYGLRADPDYWKGVLSKYKNLRVNLGHFGGLDDRTKSGWPWKIGALMTKYKYVFADVSHYTDIKNVNDQKILMKWLNDPFFRTYPKAKKRIMFGTDWIMLARTEAAEEFFTNFSEAYNAKFTDDDTADFLGGNAADFLGLRSGGKGGKNRDRLEEFYKKHNINHPDWFKRL
jgi:predicted TIM-barrel fold metal-dependent hydrolase